MVRYSFLVGLFHSLLHAGLSRRSDNSLVQKLESRSPRSEFTLDQIVDEFEREPKPLSVADLF